MAAPAPTTPTTPTVTRHIACNLCEAICGLEVDVQGERIIAIRGDEQDPLSKGHICPKAVALKDLHEDPDRLRRPVKRVGTGPDATWQEITWDEAFDLVVDGLARVRQQHGSNAVAVYQGNPNVHNYGNLTHSPRFFGLLRTRHRYSATSVDQLPHHVVARWLYGHQLLIPIPDVDRTSFFLVMGANPLASNGSLMTAPDMRGRLKALKARGGRLVVIDPRRTETAAAADQHHFIRPGTDATLLLAMIQVLFAEDLVRPGRLAAFIDDVDAVRSAIARFTPEAAATVTGIAADTIRSLARDLATADGGVVYGRMGLSTQPHGVLCQWAIQVLNILTGQLDREGGALLTRPAMDLVAGGQMGRGDFGRWTSRVRRVPEFGGELPVATLAEDILTPSQGGQDQPIRALVTSAGNPVLSTPNGAQLDRALATLDFMVSIDFYLNETTRHAHVILPPTCAVEHDHYDLVFHHLAVRNTARYSPALLPKPPGALHDWEIYNALARRYKTRFGTPAKGPLPQRLLRRAAEGLMNRLRPDQLLALGLRLGPYHLSLRRLRRDHPHGLDLGPLRPSLPGRLRTPGKRIGLMPPQAASLLAGQADALVTPPAPGLRLIGRREVRNNNSWMHNTPRLMSGKPRCTLQMHPADAAERGVADGQLVRVASRVGAVEVPVQITDAVAPGVVCLPHGFGHGRPGVRLGVATQHAGASVNDLTDDQLLDSGSGNAALNGVPVTVERVSTPTQSHAPIEAAA
ncbi:MAG: molybdopterin oxidoreductase family protein [Aquabacterium sp.]|nr:molybdopterin oxidoreductase family protein [Aquabacterium sp.]